MLGVGSVVACFCNKKIPLLFLRNIVSTVNLACKLDLKNIALHARNAEYNPKVNLKDSELYSSFLSADGF